jgi:uncharacterized protein (TIGR02117 family)
MIIKKVIRVVLKSILILTVIISIYFINAFCLSHIQIKNDQVSDADIPAYILSNGIHTDIVVPVKNDVLNWNQIINPEHTLSKDSTLNFIAFGWGDKGFYLETPTWNDLKASTAFKAAFGLSSSAMHVTYYNQLKENNKCKQIILNKKQYSKLTQYILHSFLLNENSNATNISTNLIYGNNDAFYEAVGNYSLFKTCNTWTNDALKSCGQKACVWTPFESGILNQYQN